MEGVQPAWRGGYDMKYQKALEMYLSDLKKGGYSEIDIVRKGTILLQEEDTPRCG